MKALKAIFILTLLFSSSQAMNQNFHNGKEIINSGNYIWIDDNTGYTYMRSPEIPFKETEQTFLTLTDTLFITFFRDYPSIFVLYSDSLTESWLTFTWTTEYTEGYWVVIPGTYVLLTAFGIPENSDADTIQIHIIVYENVEVNGTTYFYVDSIAFNRIQFDIVDHSGVSIYDLPGKIYDNVMTLIPLRQAYAIFSNSQYHNSKYFLSNLSPSIKVLTGCIQYDIMQNNQVHLFENTLLHGLDSSITIFNDPSEFRQTYFHYPFLNQGNDQLHFGILEGFKYKDVNDGLPNYLVGGPMYTMGSQEEWNGMIYLDMQEDTIAGFTFKMHDYLGQPPNQQNGLSTDLFDEIHDSVGFLLTLNYFPGAITVGPEDTMVVGYGARHFASSLLNNYSEPMSIKMYNWTLGEMREKYYPQASDQYVTLYDSTMTIVFAENGSNIPLINGGPGLYTAMVIDSSYSLGGYSGTYSTKFQFDLTRYNPNPPEITSLRTTDEKNRMRWNISSGDSLFVNFNTRSYRTYKENGYYQEEYIPLLEDSCKLYIRDYYSTEWEEVAIINMGVDTFMGIYYKADITALTGIDSTALSLKIVSVDIYLNRNTTVIDPAVIIGDVLINIDDSGMCYDEVVVRCYPNPFRESVELILSSPLEDSPTLKIFDIHGRLVKMISDYSQIETGTKFIWDGKNQIGSTSPSGVYLFSIITDDHTLSGRLLKTE